MADLDLSVLPEKNCYGWQLVKVEPLENLVNYKNHKRLKVFYEKGTTCAICGKKHGQYIGHYQTIKTNCVHIDVYTEDGIMINRDHIIPKSKGGANTIDNLQPTCEPCNSAKGNGDTPFEKENKKENRITNRKLAVGDIVKFNDSKFNKSKSILFEVVELKTKGFVLLKSDKEQVFKMAQSKLERYKFKIGDNVRIRKTDDIYRVDRYDTEYDTLLKLYVVDANGKSLIVNQKKLIRIDTIAK